MQSEESFVKEKILAAAFAPRVYFHSEEIYFPLAAEDYIQACDLYLGEELLGPARALLAERAYPDPNHYLKIRDFDVVYGWPPRQPQPPVYANVLPSSGSVSGLTEIQYFFCYAYNGSLFPAAPTLGAHEGDWEHVTLVVDSQAFWQGASPRRCLRAVYYAAHGGEGGWVREPPLTQHERVVVYASRYNHACYPCSGRQVRRGFGLIDDFTDESGLQWDTWQNVVLLSEREGLSWSRFAGRWGRPARRYLGENPPPLGPHFKNYYRSGQLPRLEEAKGGASEKGVEMLSFPRSVNSGLQVY